MVQTLFGYIENKTVGCWLGLKGTQNSYDFGKEIMNDSEGQDVHSYLFFTCNEFDTYLPGITINSR